MGVSRLKYIEAMEQINNQSEDKLLALLDTEQEGGEKSTLADQIFLDEILNYLKLYDRSYYLFYPARELKWVDDNVNQKVFTFSTHYPIIGSAAQPHITAKITHHLSSTIKKPKKISANTYKSNLGTFIRNSVRDYRLGMMLPPPMTAFIRSVDRFMEIPNTVLTRFTHDTHHLELTLLDISEKSYLEYNLSFNASAYDNTVDFHKLLGIDL